MADGDPLWVEHPDMRRTWKVGERGFSHYTDQWGNVTAVEGPGDEAPCVEGWDGWFTVKNDDGTTVLLNAQRFLLPELAIRFGHAAADPKS